MININNISFAYGKQQVLNDFSLEIRAGETTMITGINGSGKTTLLRLIAGVLYPQSGTITFSNEHDFDPRAKIGFISDQMSLYENMSLAEAIGFHCDIYKVKHFNEPIIDKARLNLDKRINQLSAGQKLIFHLGLLISTKPDILLIDEVIHSMDVYLREMFLNQLLDLIAERNVTLVMVNLNYHDIEKIPQRIILLKDGRVEVDEDLDSLKRKVKRIVSRDEILDLPVLMSHSFADKREYFIYPFEPDMTAKIKGKTEDLSLNDIIKAFIGGEYA